MDQHTTQFVERMGRHFEADGIPRIGGRLYGYLVLQDEPRSLDELATVLAVSKTSVSTNARLLEQWGLIERVTRPGDRRDFYVIAADATRQLELRLARIRQFVELLEEARALVPPERRTVRRRLDAMRATGTEMVDQLSAVLRRWRAPQHRA